MRYTTYDTLTINGVTIRMEATHSVDMGIYPIGTYIKLLWGSPLNRNRLDNRRCNLRWVTHAQNCHNSKRNQFEYKGVKLDSGSPTARILKLHLGVFGTLEEAAQGYDKDARHYFGDYAYLNYPNIYIYIYIMRGRSGMLTTLQRRLSLSLST